MITNFETTTYELTETELSVIPVLIKGFGLHRKENPIKSPELTRRLNMYLTGKGIKINVTEARLRKFCNYIRSNGLLPLIATSNGYFVSYDKKEIAKQITSLYERGTSIIGCANGLKKFCEADYKENLKINFVQ